MKKIINKIFNIFLCLLKIIFYISLFFITLTMIFGLLEDLFYANTLIKPISMYFWVYEFFNLLLCIIFLMLFFINTGLVKKFVILILCFAFLYFLPWPEDLKEIYAYDTCLDVGVCAEGLKINLGGDGIEQVNEENCIKYKHLWKDGKCYVR